MSMPSFIKKKIYPVSIQIFEVPKTASTSLPVNLDSDVTLVEIIGDSDGDSDYVESSTKSPTSPVKTRWTHQRTGGNAQCRGERHRRNHTTNGVFILHRRAQNYGACQF